MIFKVKKILKAMKKLMETNNQIAEGIIGIRSGSALLLELKVITPTKVQLTSIDTRKKNLDLMLL